MHFILVQSVVAAENYDIPLPRSPWGRDVVIWALAPFFQRELTPPAIVDGRLRIDKATAPEELREYLSQMAVGEEREAEPSTRALAMTRKLLLSETYSKKIETLVSPPKTVAELERKFSFSTWEKYAVAPSKVKGLTRVIYQSPEKEPSIHIAQTLETETQDFSARVRETEIILKDSTVEKPRYAFFAYDSQGQLARSSHFATKTRKDVPGPVPYTCLTCHHQKSPPAFSPEVGGN